MSSFASIALMLCGNAAQYFSLNKCPYYDFRITRIIKWMSLILSYISLLLLCGYFVGNKFPTFPLMFIGTMLISIFYVFRQEWYEKKLYKDSSSHLVIYVRLKYLIYLSAKNTKWSKFKINAWQTRFKYDIELQPFLTDNMNSAGNHQDLFYIQMVKELEKAVNMYN